VKVDDGDRDVGAIAGAVATNGGSVTDTAQLNAPDTQRCGRELLFPSAESPDAETPDRKDDGHDDDNDDTLSSPRRRRSQIQIRPRPPVCLAL